MNPEIYHEVHSNVQEDCRKYLTEIYKHWKTQNRNPKDPHMDFWW